VIESEKIQGSLKKLGRDFSLGSEAIEKGGENIDPTMYHEAWHLAVNQSFEP
jgi:hypothetical protein